MKSLFTKSAAFGLLFLVGSLCTVQAGDFDRPSTKGSIPSALKQACTAEKSPMIKTIKDRGTLNWALGLSPPFGFRQSDGSYGGIEVDNAHELAHFLGVKVSIKDYDYNLLPTALVTGQADIIADDVVIVFRSVEALPETMFSNDILYLNTCMFIFDKQDGVISYVDGGGNEKSFSLTRANKMFEEIARRVRVLTDLLKENKVHKKIAMLILLVSMSFAKEKIGVAF